MWIEIEHELTFEYSDFITESRIELRIEPRTTSHQTLRSFSLAIGPPTDVNRYVDWNDNLVHHFGIGGYHNRIEIVSTSIVETHPGDNDLSHYSAPPPNQSELGPLRQMLDFDGPIVCSRRLEELAGELRSAPGASVGAQIADTGDLIRERFTYQPGISDFKSTTDHLIEARAGVCQDFAHMQIALLRLRGIPTRYVSGYLHLGTGEAAQSHAWIEAYAGQDGWVRYDPTHSQMPDERYVLVGWGRNYDDVAPNRGVFRGSASERLNAVVRTRETEPLASVDLQEQFAQLDVPVSPEIPPMLDGSGDALADRRNQQQQQNPKQQQQQSQ